MSALAWGAIAYAVVGVIVAVVVAAEESWDPSMMARGSTAVVAGVAWPFTVLFALFGALGKGISG